MHIRHLPFPLDSDSLTLFDIARNAYAPLEGRAQEAQSQDLDLVFAIWLLGNGAQWHKSSQVFDP